MGDLATRAVVGRACAITKVRGTLLEGQVYPVLSPTFCRAVMEQLPLFKSDMSTLYKLYKADFDLTAMGGDKANYYWCTDIQHILDLKPKMAAIDTETTGLRTTEASFKVLTVQIAYNENDVAVVPLHHRFWPKGTWTPAKELKVREQVKMLCEDNTVRKVGHNINYDVGALAAEGIELRGILGDTQLMAWFVDENMTTKTLDDCIRRWVPEMAGYNDQYNVDLDKGNFINLPEDMFDKFLNYGAGDARGTYRLFWPLWEEIRKNPQQYKLFLKLKMPGLLAFHKMSENGILIDREYLASLKVIVAQDLIDIKEKLLAQVPKAVVRKHMDDPKQKGKKQHEILKFSRANFVRDILFSKEGFKLKPLVFTKSTADGEKDQQVASTSAKDHLPYFTDIDGAAGDFVNDFIEYTKLAKLYSTYISKFDENYVHEDGKIHPQFNLHITVTGRSSSRGPNAQNFPSRGPWAKKYKKLFVASPGYKFVSADLSQIELRLIAWESKDPVMLAAYRDGKDIHKITAMAVSGHTEETWALLPKDEQKLLRYRAKAVNFGLCYGMHWKKFKRFAKTDYGLELTDEQAAAYYNTYHRLYCNIKKWHSDRTMEAGRNGFVMSLHGAKRNVPSIFHDDKYIRSQAARQAINSPIQGFGSDLGVLGIARLARQCDPNIIRPVAFIHDDIILEVKDGYEELGVNTLLWVLNNPPLKEMFNIQPPIPILAEPDIGLNLGEMIELYDLKDDEKPFWLPEFKINPQKPAFWNEARDLF
jgi:DNA polymerase I-like protein with 3'-5' exonuclease and polymerase domains